MEFFPQTFIFPSTSLLTQISTPYFLKSSKKIPMPPGSSNPTINPKAKAFSCLKKSTNSKKSSPVPTSTPPSKTFKPTTSGSFPVTSITRCSSAAKNSISECIVSSLLTALSKPGCSTKASEGFATSCTLQMWPKLTTCSSI